MARASRNVFTTIKSEGGLLPPDFLQRIAEGHKDIDGLKPDDYHLTAGEKPSEAASRSWNRLQAVWTAFQTASQSLKADDAGTSLTREKWLLPLFNELGYGRLQAAKTFEIDGKAYPISHLWQQTPIHLVGRNVKLDERSPGVAGAAKTTPHGLLQEFLNRHEGHLWGFVSNGLKLRILRDNKSLTRQAYVEFDLAGMMDGQVYSDFALLWLLCHQSRVEAEKAEQCWLEKWAEAARQRGTRALDQLRDGVQGAIEALGKGFLAHPANKDLIDKLRQGQLDKQDYYRQLLRVVYRLIFLCVAEDRDLLLTAERGAKERKRYLDHYSAQRLRTLAERRRGTPHPDLWQGMKLVFAKLSSDTGCPELGLPALGSFLWSDRATLGLDKAELQNAHLLEAVRHLAFTKDGHIRRAIDYRNLGAEELGSVYESLLELHPNLNADAATFELKVAAGHERKTTGSYYTPTSLIECLLDSALEPVLQEALKQPDPEKAILDLKVCDPACGSGHFLIAAAHRMANRLATVRTGDEEPSPEAVRKALRDIVGRCLYGVDINPMAVELCKVNLWLEALEPGKPLSFLEHHIQCGNSLLGATPALLKNGIPDEAFEPLEGDHRPRATELKRRNKLERSERERAGVEGVQQTLFAGFDPFAGVRAVAKQVSALDASPDTDRAAVSKKESTWSEIVASPEYRRALLVAHTWCAAFVWPKRDAKAGKPEPYAPTDRVFRDLLRDPETLPAETRTEVERIAEDYSLLHWHLAFPTVFAASDTAPAPGWTGGFDVVLGNPPWDRIKLQEKEFFAERHPEIAEAPNAAARGKLIKALETSDPALFAAFRAALRKADGESALVRSTDRYPLCGRGDVNTYAIFAELNSSLLSPHGRAGFIVPSGIATDDTTKFFFEDLTRVRSLVSLYSFFETRRVFPGTDSRAPFCLLTIRSAGSLVQSGDGEFAFDLRSTGDLAQSERRFRLSAEDIALLNPNTRTCPIFRTRRDAEITKAIYQRVPVLIDESKGEAGNPWGIEFARLFDMSNDSGLFRTRKQLEAQGWTLEGNIFRKGEERYLPLYEAKMVHHFDHRYGDYADKPEGSENTSLPEVPPSRLADPSYAPLPRYWVPDVEVEDRLRGRWDRGWLLGWRDICRSTDERTVIASVLPRMGAGDKFLLMFPEDATKGACLCANLNSLAFDYIARQKLGGTSLKYFVMKQLPVLPPATFEQRAPWDIRTSVGEWVRTKVVELVYTSADLQPFARDAGHDGPPFTWDTERRAHVRCELDAAFFRLYGAARDDVAQILDTFSIVRAHDEKVVGSFQTRTNVLREFDRLDTQAAHMAVPAASSGPPGR